MIWLEGTRLEPALFDPDVTHYKKTAIRAFGADVQNLAFV